MATSNEEGKCHKRSGSYEILPPYLSEEKDTGLTLPSLNLVLFGSSGAGKTSAAESILGRAELPAASSPGECVKHEGEVCGRRVSLVELPALSGKPLKTVMEQCLRCISLCAPEGVHAFILVLPLGPLTDEDKAELKTIQDTLSSRVLLFTVILFTVDSESTAPAELQFVTGDRDIQELCQSCGGGDLIFNPRDQQKVSELLKSVETVEDYIENESDESFKELISNCGNRFHVFNNRIKEDRTQVKELMKKIDAVVKKNGGECYTSAMLLKAEVDMKTEILKILKEKDRERDEMERKYKEEINEMTNKYEEKIKEVINQKSVIEGRLQQNKKQMEDDRTKWENERKSLENLFVEKYEKQIREIEMAFEEEERKQAEEFNLIKEMLQEKKVVENMQIKMTQQLDKILQERQERSKELKEKKEKIRGNQS